MSTAKLPFVVLFWISTLAVSKPPQPPAPKEERIDTGKLADNTTASAFRVIFAIVFQTTSMLVEVATILAMAYPTHPLSGTVISALTFKGAHPQKISMNRYSMAGVLFMALGGIIRQWAFRTLGEFFRYEVSIQKDHELVTTGPYAVVRHPAYTGLVLAVTGGLLYTFSCGSWLRESGLLNTTGGKVFMGFHVVFGSLGALVQVLGRMTTEDKIMREHFGKKWDDWAKKVPYKVIPRVW